VCLNGTYLKVHIGKISDKFSVQNWLKQGDALPPLLFNFALDYSIRKFLENQVGLEFSGTNPLLVYVDDFNLRGDSLYTTREQKIPLRG
jgi:hypothetical protein